MRSPSCAVVLALVASTTAARGEEPATPERAAPPPSEGRAGALVDAVVIPPRFVGLVVTPSPSFATYAPLLDQAQFGVDVVAVGRFRTLGPELAGSQLSARMLVGRTIGAARLSLEGAVGQGLGARSDVDFEAAAALAVRATQALWLGAEARARGEIEDRFVTEEDVGRPVELATGAVVGVDLAPARVQALGGIAWPRGELPPGPLAVVSTTLAF